MEPNPTIYHAILAIEYTTPAEYVSGDFGKNEFVRYKKWADKAETVERMYSPFPHVIQATPEKVALFYFEKAEKFYAFLEYRRLRESKNGEFFGSSYEYNAVESKIKSRR